MGWQSLLKNKCTWLKILEHCTGPKIRSVSGSLWLCDVIWNLDFSGVTQIEFSEITYKLHIFVKKSNIFSSCAMRFLSKKIWNPLIETFAGWKWMLQGHRIYFVWNLRLISIESNLTTRRPGQFSNMGWAAFISLESCYDVLKGF